MSAGTITITAGRPNRQGDEKDFSGPDGTYTATLAAVSEPVTEKSSLADAKGDGTWTYRTWTFAMEPDGEVLDTRANPRSAGPKSRQYGIIAALVGRTPTVGAVVDIQRHLVGRLCLVSIETNDNDYPYIKTFMALPPAKGEAPAPVAVPAPVPPAAPEPVATTAAPVVSDDLPVVR
jgi:hypothetical protein